MCEQVGVIVSWIVCVRLLVGLVACVRGCVFGPAVVCSIASAFLFVFCM